MAVKNLLVLAICAAGLAGCAGSERAPKLLNATAEGPGPDEFGVLPVKPLEAPADYTELPAPTPGATNLTDPTPLADAVAALGGNPDRLTGGGIRDRALIAHTTRFGLVADIRAALAAADLEYRRTHDGKPLERLFNVNVYFAAYQAMELDKYAELERFRAAGVRTPAVPPPGTQ